MDIVETIMHLELLYLDTSTKINGVPYLYLIRCRLGGFLKVK